MSAPAIHAQRARSNAAIVARDADRIVALMLADVRVDVAGGTCLVGPDASRAAFVAQFADASFRGYVRQPTEVVMHDPPTSATEHGQWIGRWRRGIGEQQMRGVYVAEWRHTDMGWLIASEHFRESSE